MVSSLIWRSRRYDLTLQEENIALEVVPHVEELLADLLQVVDGGGVKVGLGAAAKL